jgi:coenzyme F420-reducing hydrogenase beta subunit
LENITRLAPVRCTGCGVCRNVCPVYAIETKPDDEGFLRPVVSKKLCTGCGACIRMCPVLNRPAFNEKWQDTVVYAAWSLDKEVRYNSTSGGVFTELTKNILKEGGYVAGARYNDKYLVEHDLIQDIDDIAILRQSKYIQSDTKDIFKRVKKVVKMGKSVLFCGTPCQCAGLTVYLERPFDNLILCDFICRGVNSPMVYLKYLDELQRQYASPVRQIWFKNKTISWNRFGTKIIFENGREYFKDRDTDLFMCGYIKKGLNLYIRPSCGRCEFKGTARPVDITLGDFWGVKLIESMDDQRNGVSCVLVYSEKGKLLIDKAGVYKEKQDIDTVIRYNRCLVESASFTPGNRELFFRSLIRHGFFNTMQLFMDKQ